MELKIPIGCPVKTKNCFYGRLKEKGEVQSLIESKIHGDFWFNNDLIEEYSEMIDLIARRHPFEEIKK